MKNIELYDKMKWEIHCLICDLIYIFPELAEKRTDIYKISCGNLEQKIIQIEKNWDDIDLSKSLFTLEFLLKYKQLKHNGP